MRTYYDRDSANLLNSCLVIMAMMLSRSHQNASKVYSSKASYEWIVWKCSTLIVFAYDYIEFETLIIHIRIGSSLRRKKNCSSKAKTLFNILYCLKWNHENLFHLMFEVFFSLCHFLFFACSFMCFNFFICIRRWTKVEAHEAFASGGIFGGRKNWVGK